MVEYWYSTTFYIMRKGLVWKKFEYKFVQFPKEIGFDYKKKIIESEKQTQINARCYVKNLTEENLQNRKRTIR